MGRFCLDEDKATAKIKRLRLLLFDVDGVLTNGELVYGPGNAEYKRFNAQDGLGFVLAQKAGLKTGIITARCSELVERRAKELNLDCCFQGYEKVPAFEKVLAEHGLIDDEVCYMGDDLLDLALMRRAGFSAAPANARPEIVSSAHYVTSTKGGEGAARELIEVVLKARDAWEPLLKIFLSDCKAWI
ncbi:3-deoxy-D-manno-octulosonate 8-phosphate phosphatase [candidate division KSB1 bacterium]|nr:HAD hydrolase family protein [candidate division KSB1 bacterium]RQV99805.1 MAG: 3-deoxy-D-manno-octulosonate 8-phosphate phosphatase [candidate division KSB1 bacterium]